jgi:tetratricopeptide (TPR) repeat protein
MLGQDDIVPSPPWVDALIRDAEAAEARGNPALAIAVLQRAAAAWPVAATLRQLGLGLASAGRMAEAEAALRAALTRAPTDAETRYVLGVCQTALGRRREGAALAQARFELPRLTARKPAGFGYPEWRGEPAPGRRLVIFPEMELADQILAARFVPALLSAGMKVTLFSRPELARLFAESFPGAEVLSASGSVSFEAPDLWTMATSLVGLVAPAQPPPAPPYLRAAAVPGGDGFRVALSLDGLPDDPARRLRAELPGTPIELAESGRDLAETAAQIAGADLVICHDGVAAQLASGLGAHALVLAPARGVHWSFGMGPQAALWHPTAQVFRADPRGDWSSAVERLLAEAQARAGR